MKTKPPEKDSGFSDLFRGVNHLGYGFWSFPKNKPYMGFLLGLMYLIAIPIMVGIILLSFFPAFWLRDFLYNKGFFDDTGFGSIMFSMLAFYLPIYILYKVIDYIKQENKRKKVKPDAINKHLVGLSETLSPKLIQELKDLNELKKTSIKNVKPLETKNKKSKPSREEIIKRLKEFKDLYDSGILNKEEYEKESSKLKDLLIGN